ncbi:MAG: nucleotidyltransferase [Dehalococcoidia bacterium]
MIDFPKLLRLLTEHDVAFIIIGGVAAVIHGSSRLTQDLDIVYHRSPENLTHLVQALAEQSPYLRGAPPGLPFQWSVATLRMGLNFTLETSVGPLDLLGEVTGGGSYEDLLEHTIEVEVFGVRCHCLDLPALIRTKRAAGRPKDLEAIAELEVIWEEQQEG